MTQMANWMRRLCSDRRGATAVEYGLIVALIVIAIIAAIMGLANKTSSMWNNVSRDVTRVT